MLSDPRPRYRRHTRGAACCAFAALIAGLSACSREPAVLGDANYAALDLVSACTSQHISGAGATDDLLTTSGVAFSVRAPRNYDPARAHPLLIVLAPAGYDRHRSERFAGLTTGATAAGFVVAYADHVKLTMAAFPRLGEIPKQVAGRWCIDPARVIFAGHSDGGSSAAGIAFLNASPIGPSAVVISASGLRTEDLRQYACPVGVDAMIVHSRGDERFALPEFGREPAQWWAACNRCAPAPGPADAQGCMAYGGCAAGTRVHYCEVTTMHAQWPGLEGQILRFASEARK